MFLIDERIASTSLVLADWPLSRVLLKNEVRFPWFILVPRVNDIQELYQLASEEQQLLVREMNKLSLIIKDYYNPDKLNVAALGNIVSQLHIHVVARFKDDALWPEGIWQVACGSQSYEEQALEALLPKLTALMCNADF